MAVNPEQVKSLLGQGLANEVVASAVGCSPSYISQLLADEQFSADVTKLRVESLAKHNARDNKLDDIEDKLISNLAEAVEQRQIYKPHEVLNCFRIINAAKRRGTAAGLDSQKLQGVVVNLTIPVAIAQKFVTNSVGEVVEVDGKSLVTIAPERLLQDLKAHAANEAHVKEYTKILGKMPGAIQQYDRDGKPRE